MERPRFRRLRRLLRPSITSPWQRKSFVNMSRGRTVNSVFPSDGCLTCRRPRTFGSSSARLLGSQEAAHPMHSNSILHEIRQLYNVSDRLDLLAEQHPL